MNGDPRQGREFLGAGMAFPPALDGQGRFLMTGLDDHVRQSIRLILETARGERVMRQDFGSGLHRLVFSPPLPATASLLQHEVKQALLRFEPRIDLLAVDVALDPKEREVLRVSVSYRVRRTDTMFNLVYPFYLERGEV